MLVVVWLSLHRWDLLGPILLCGDWIIGARCSPTRPSATRWWSSLLFTAIVVLCAGGAGAGGGGHAGARAGRGRGCLGALYVHPVDLCSPLAVAVLVALDPGPHSTGRSARCLGHRIEWLTDPGVGAAGGGGGGRCGRTSDTSRCSSSPGDSGDPRRRSTPRPASTARDLLAAILADHRADAAAHVLLRPR